MKKPAKSRKALARKRKLARRVRVREEYRFRRFMQAYEVICVDMASDEDLADIVVTVRKQLTRSLVLSFVRRPIHTPRIVLVME